MDILKSKLKNFDHIPCQSAFTICLFLNWNHMYTCYLSGNFLFSLIKIENRIVLISLAFLSCKHTFHPWCGLVLAWVSLAFCTYLLRNFFYSNLQNANCIKTWVMCEKGWLHFTDDLRHFSSSVTSKSVLEAHLRQHRAEGRGAP